MLLTEKKHNKMLLIVIALTLTIISFMLSTQQASAATYTNDNQDNSFYFYQGGPSQYWHYDTCSLCVNGSYIYTGNNTNSVSNYGIWYFRGVSDYYNMAANIPNASGANTTNAIYWLSETSSSSQTGVSVNQKAIGGWTTFFTSRWISNAGYIELTDKTLEPSGTTNIGFDAISWSN